MEHYCKLLEMNAGLWCTQTHMHRYPSDLITPNHNFLSFITARAKIPHCSPLLMDAFIKPVFQHGKGVTEPSKSRTTQRSTALLNTMGNVVTGP